jgi:hypothetical protein
MRNTIVPLLEAKEYVGGISPVRRGEVNPFTWHHRSSDTHVSAELNCACSAGGGGTIDSGCLAGRGFVGGGAETGFGGA